MESLRVVRLSAIYSAYYGEADSGEQQLIRDKSFVRGMRVTDAHGNQRYVRQVFLPSLWSYTAGLLDIENNRKTDADLVDALNKLNYVKAYFE